MQRQLAAIFAISVGAVTLFGAPYIKAALLRLFKRGPNWVFTYERFMLNLPGYVFMLRFFGLIWLLAGLYLATAKVVPPK